MEKYLFIRDFGAIKKKSTLVVEGKGYRALSPEGKRVIPKIKEISNHLRVHLLPLDADVLKTAFNSFAYTNWLKEKAADIDERGDPRFPGLVKSPETLIMYLMELGINSSTLLHYIYGADNKYLEYKYLVQEFGKMI